MEEGLSQRRRGREGKKGEKGRIEADSFSPSSFASFRLRETPSSVLFSLNLLVLLAEVS
jgi:hypothetical protein